MCRGEVMLCLYDRLLEKEKMCELSWRAQIIQDHPAVLKKRPGCVYVHVYVNS
jgi:hypothetical protein